MVSIDQFFFFKQKTAYEMRISDWSSDVCSSDLKHSEDMWRSVIDKLPFGPTMPPTVSEISARFQRAAAADLAVFRRTPKWPGTNVALTLTLKEIGRASCRERVCQYV